MKFSKLTLEPPKIMMFLWQFEREERLQWITKEDKINYKRLDVVTENFYLLPGIKCCVLIMFK